LAIQTPAALLAHAQTRWTEISASQPDLGPAIALQRSLVTRTIHTVSQLGNLKLQVVTLEPERTAAKLRAGVPALRGESVTLPTTMLKPLVLESCEDLAEGGAGDVARRVHDCLTAGRIDINSLLTASFGRDQNSIRIKANHEAIAPDVLWLVAELAVGPAAHLAQQALLAQTSTGKHPVLANALNEWPYGYCLACGSWPAFGEGSEQSRQLRCSFCGLSWQPQYAGCLYCDGEPSHLSWLTEEPNSAHRAELCSRCHGYLKWLNLSKPTPFELLPIEDLASTQVDLLAAQKGFVRPSLPELDGQARPPCQMLKAPRA